MKVDWGNLCPTEQERAALASRLERLELRDRGVIVLRRRGGAYEARLCMATRGDTTELRLQDVTVMAAVDRLLSLVDIVGSERRSLH
jgi:hypothetical protein